MTERPTTTPSIVPRACLVVPASEPRKVEKALGSSADEVVLDLEDAVTPALKDAARRAALDVVGRSDVRPSLAVRVNQVGTAWCHRDVLELVAHTRHPLTLVLPKADRAGITFADALVRGARAERAARGDAAAPEVRLDALVETAAALRDLDGALAASTWLRAVVVGYADLAADLGREPRGDVTLWDPVRAQLVCAARAAGLALVDGPWLGVRADDAFRADLARARAHGFDGTWVIHPDQIDDALFAFTPSADEVAWARRVLAALADAADRGQGAASLDGAMLDEALALRARAVVARDEAAHITPSETDPVDTHPDDGGGR